MDCSKRSMVLFVAVCMTRWLVKLKRTVWCCINRKTRERQTRTMGKRNTRKRLPLRPNHVSGDTSRNTWNCIQSCTEVMSPYTQVTPLLRTYLSKSNFLSILFLEFSFQSSYIIVTQIFVYIFSSLVHFILHLKH